jgi:GNAT superfamily N-acetyltransferase
VFPTLQGGMIEITPLRETDRPGWQPLAVGYNAFYERVPTDADYDRTWRRLMKGEEMHGLAARLDGRVVGIAHYLFHASIWFDDVCYLADLFVDETVRGQGAARALIEAVADGGARPRLPALLLADQAGQCPRPRALRQGRTVRGLHPLRLSDGIGAAGVRLRAAWPSHAPPRPARHAFSLTSSLKAV